MPNLSDRAAQATTLATATRIGTHYTQSELTKIAERRSAGHTAEQIAVELKRSLYGVRGTVHNLTERTERAAASPRRPVLPYDLGFTTLEEMGF